VREIVAGLRDLPAVRGALVVAPDGFVIAAAVPAEVAVDPIAALAATVGRDLERGGGRLGAYQTAMLTAQHETLVLAASPIGFVVALAEGEPDLPALRAALAEAVTLIEAAWAPPPAT
jgi:predicted regulator of Ras-like GTPase activity (Roadblock/LC7/MglB family)